jgi:hypothetical protein
MKKKTSVPFASMLHMRYYIMTILILNRKCPYRQAYTVYISNESEDFQHVDFELNFLVGEEEKISKTRPSAAGNTLLTHCWLYNLQTWCTGHRDGKLLYNAKHVLVRSKQSAVKRALGGSCFPSSFSSTSTRLSFACNIPIIETSTRRCSGSNKSIQRDLP